MTADSFVLKVLKGGDVVEEAALCCAQSDRSVSVIINASRTTSKYQLRMDGGCLALRYFLENRLVLEEDVAMLSGYSAVGRRFAEDRQIYERVFYLRQFIQKIREDSWFNERVTRSVFLNIRPTGGPVIDWFGTVCRHCWNGIYLPQSCNACILCNGFTLDLGTTPE